MLKSKRFNGSMAAVVVLAVILAVAVTASATMAWFASQDSEAVDFRMGDSVVVTITDEDSLEISKLDFQIPAAYLVPGMQILPAVYADVTSSTTSALLRAKVDVKATWDAGKEPTAVPAGWTKVDAAGEDPEHYTSATYTAKDLTTLSKVYAYIIETHLMSNFIAKANGWYFDNDTTKGNYFYFVGNSEAYSKVLYETADLSDPDDIKYALYRTAGEGGDYTNSTKDTLLVDEATGLGDAAGTHIASIVTLAEADDEGALYNEGWSEGFAHVPFLVRPVTIPVGWGNAVANAKVEIEIQFEAIQDYLVDPDTSNLDELEILQPTLTDAKKVFESALALNPSI